MWALCKREAKPGLSLEKVTKPTCGDDEVLIKVLRSAICGTDVHIYEWDSWAQRTIPVPLVIGHEFMGEIVEVGHHVRARFEPGQRVSAEGHFTCGLCRNCREGQRHLCPNTQGLGVHRNGAFANYVTIPAENVFALPDNIPNDIAAFFDPFGNAVHTALSFNVVGEDVLVTGAGPIGIMAAAVCRHAGARNVVITDINPYRLALAKTMNIQTVVDVRTQSLQDTMRSLGMHEGFTVGLEISGVASAFHSMIEHMSHGGRMALLGILGHDVAIDWHKIIFKSLQIKGIYGREIFGTWHRMTALLQSGLDLAPIITHHYTPEQFQQAFDIMRSGQSGKVIFQWD